jgi:copper chaperone CopZ
MTKEIIQTIRVEGMTCSHCEANVNRTLLKLEGIEEVVADKNTSFVKIMGDEINLSEIEKAVTEIGFQYKGVV